jgi:putative chitinase
MKILESLLKWLIGERPTSLTPTITASNDPQHNQSQTQERGQTTRQTLVSPDQIRLMAPNSNYTAIGPALNDACNEFGIVTHKEIRHFIAQVSVESSHFLRLVENLNYSATRLTQVWPKRFPTLSDALPYANNPEALANYVYGGRLGNVNPDDGWTFRGRGFIQLTGRANYNECGKALKIDLVGNPSQAATVKTAARIAAWYWKVHSLNQIVDSEATDDAIETETRAINGGLIDLEQRKMELHKAKLIWLD